VTAVYPRTVLLGWVKAFVFTQLVEGPMYRRLVPTRWGLALGASTITHPFVWFAFPWLGDVLDLGWTTTSILSEVFAVVVEALFFRTTCAIGWRRAALVSIVANAASVSLGLLARTMFGIV